jgi:predicted TIM-barrel fold metal-dependent hydrolase
VTGTGWIVVATGLVVSVTVAAEPPVPQFIDAHIHYSADAWQTVPVEQAVALLRQAGLSKAFVSSSSDDGTLKLLEAAPDLVVPVLRPYRSRGELGTWMHDDTVIDLLRERLDTYRYAGIGEFHAFGDDMDLPVLRQVVELARHHGLFLHAHSDTDAVRRIFVQDPDAVVLWAHAGFEGPEEIAGMLDSYPNLWADLAFRSEHAIDGKLEPAWRELFERFPDRFLLGTDTFTPERWFYVSDHAEWNRAWLAELKPEVREAIARGNAERLLLRVWK